jgi:uncharacterized repeat protein (TIGR02543 family)
VNSEGGEVKLLRAVIALLVLCLLGACSLGTDIDELRNKVKGGKQDSSYTVTFNSNGGSSVAAQTVKSGGAAARPANPTRSGYVFDDWYSNAELTAVYDFSTPVTGDITLYARWNEVPPGSFVVTFNSNGGSNVPDQIVESGGTAARPANPIWSGYTFDNWYSDTDLTTVYDFSAPVTENITLYAKWNEVPPGSFTVTFNSNGGNNIPDQIVESGGTATRPANPTHSGHTFDNWYSDTDLTTMYNFSAPVTGNITLYAKWNFSGDIPGNSLAAKLAWLQTNALSGLDYTVEVTADESIVPHTLSYGDRNDITIILKGIGANRTISLYSTKGSIFTVDSGVTLILENNITIEGRSSNDNAIVVVYSDGTFIMNDGSTITGNTAGFSGGGVSVDGGTFTMNGGEISGNTAVYTGGGVYVDGGTFTMNGGKISGNTATDGGGGVYVGGTFIMNGGEISGNTSSSGGGVCVGGGTFTRSGGTFMMEGGKISSNTASGFYSSSGGGVYVDGSWVDNGVWVGGGTFTMSGGEISGNTASSSSSDSEYGDISQGGGVYVGGGTFTMSGGEISGNTAAYSSSDSGYDYSDVGGGGVYVDYGTFTMSGGEISGNTAQVTNSNNDVSGGGGVYMNGGTFTKTGGTITGYASDTVNGNVVKDGSGTVLNNRGHAVYAVTYYFGSSNERYKETTIGPGVNLSFDGTANPPTWSGEWADEYFVPGNTLANKLSWLQTNAQSNVDYVLEVNADEGIAPQSLSYTGKSNITITLIGIDANRTISLSSNGAMFTVGSGVTLVLDNNVTLQGNSSNTDSMVYIYSSGTLIMNDGSTITGNTTTSSGGGVWVGDRTFMVRGGTFTMNGGTISDNTASNGGGVLVYNASSTFTMNGGTIYGNAAASVSYGAGGGVYVGAGTFTKTGGTIYGYNQNDTNSNAVKDSSGTVVNNQGHAVYVSIGGSNPVKRRETTAGPGVNLSYNGIANPPTFSGEWEE